MHSLLLPADHRPIAGISQTNLLAANIPREMRDVLPTMQAMQHLARPRYGIEALLHNSTDMTCISTMSLFSVQKRITQPHPSCFVARYQTKVINGSAAGRPQPRKMILKASGKGYRPRLLQHGFACGHIITGQTCCTPPRTALWVYPVLNGLHMIISVPTQNDHTGLFQGAHRLTVPLPPVLTVLAILDSFSLSICTRSRGGYTPCHRTLPPIQVLHVFWICWLWITNTSSMPTACELYSTLQNSWKWDSIDEAGWQTSATIRAI